MVSINDGEDFYFWKVEFDFIICFIECWWFCEKVCFAEVIVFFEKDNVINFGNLGVIDEFCYGCGRCLFVCLN